ncbi:MAG: hypothetical protein V3U74_02925 [Thermodesulfobacteriota bacterium]
MAGAKHIRDAIEDIKRDNLSGAAEITRRASGVLIAAAKLPADDADSYISTIRQTALSLISSQPSMAPLINLANSVLLEIEKHHERETVRDAVVKRANTFISDMERGAEKIAAHTTDILNNLEAPARILTYSYSSTVLSSLIKAKDSGLELRVICTESRPNYEGKKVLETIRANDIPVTYGVDMTVFGLLSKGMADTVLIGADCVSREGVVNKAGTLGIAMACSHLGIPLYILSGEEKFLPSGLLPYHSIVPHPAGEVLTSHDEGTEVINTYFDTTPLALITGFVTPRGVLNSEEVKATLRKGDVATPLSRAPNDPANKA